MTFFAQLETACATAVERAFAMAFPSALEPVQVARKLVAAFESGASPAGRVGRRFVVRLSPADFSRLAADLPYLERQWGAMLARLSERSGRPERTPEVCAEESGAVASGTVTIVTEALPEPRELALRVRRGMPDGARIVLVDPRVSRRHLEIVSDGAAFRFRDLDSSNGTIVNGAPAAQGELGLGDLLLLGDSELTVEPG